MIVQSLRERGIELSIVNGNLRIGPKDRLTDDVLDTIRANKKQIAQELRAASQLDQGGSFYLIDGKVKPVPEEDIPLIQVLPYVCLKDLPPTALLLYSSVLGERIWLVTSLTLVERLQKTGKTVYVLEEIIKLLEQNSIDPASIKAMHAIKSGFPGSMVQ